jgi:hypothetical protein
MTPHNVVVNSFRQVGPNPGALFQARCTCEWVGPERTSEHIAEVDREKHIHDARNLRETGG